STSPGCIEPAFPNACSTGLQSPVAACCWLLGCAELFCGAEQATNTNKVATANATRHSTTLLVLCARDIWPNTRRGMFLSLFIFTPAFLLALVFRSRLFT